MPTLTLPPERAPATGAPRAPWVPVRTLEPDLAPARRDLLGQIAKLDKELAEVQSAAWLTVAGADSRAPARPRAPRLLGFDELEGVRDRLVDELAVTRRVIEEREVVHAANRRLLERAIDDPRRHKFLRLPLADLGQPGCGAYEVRPRMGLIGMLAGWWEVKL